MTGIGENTGATAKVLQVLKDLPLWLLTGLAVAAGVILLFPWFDVSIPAAVRPWVIVVAVVFGVLAIVRAVAVLVEKIPTWRASADARRRFSCDS